MQRERVAEDIYVFASDLYAEVTATVVATSDGALVFDTLLYPEETLLIKRFVESRLNMPVRYLINSHFHADHSAGTCFFEQVPVIAHAQCRELLDHRGRESLERAKAASDEMRDVEIVLPGLVFESGHFHLYLGNKSFELWQTPGHSQDSIVCLVKEDRVLLAADTLMPIPYFVDGSFEDYVTSLTGLRSGNFENVIQGHGDVILRGEIEEKIESDLEYLHALRNAVDTALTSGDPDKALKAIDIERCGKSRILLNGAVEQLHRQNVLALASQRREMIQM
jgi:glyoxylase-like metal-dependent hydrolase (beta-lactamase superfamily II)